MKVVETCECCQGKGILPDLSGNESGCFNCTGTGTLKYDTDDAPADACPGETKASPQTCDAHGVLRGGVLVCRHHGSNNACLYNYGCEHQKTDNQLIKEF
jgi:hypothetical protein